MKLTIELVPQSSWMNNVRAVLSTTQWNALKSIVYDKAYSVCEICGGTGPKHPVECHETWHYDEETGIQKLTGMIALCPDCHMVKHIGLARVQGKYELAFKHFMKINGMKKAEAEDYVEKAFKTWRARGFIKWKLDLSVLKKYGVDVDKIKEPK